MTLDSRLFVLIAALASLPAVTLASGPDWERLDSLEDLRFKRAEVLPLGSGEPVLVALPRPWTGLGGTWTHLRVGPGWVRLLEEPHRVTIALSGERASGEALRSGPRVDLLSGAGVRAAGPMLLEATPAGTALRWTRLEWPRGSAAVDLLLPDEGAARVQYLNVSEDTRERVLEHGLVAGRVEGLPQTGLLPRSAEAWRLGRDAAPVLGRRPEPRAAGPPPIGCDPAAGDWCAQAGGATSIFMNETFDDGLSTARGWTAGGEWTETAFSDCSPGASADPGMAWYFGDTGSCSYSRNSNGDLISPTIGPITATTNFTFAFRLDMEECGFPQPCEEALILVNGTPQWSLADPGDPLSWFNLQAIDLSPWAGQMITLGFRFTTDNKQQRTGWFIDDLAVWDTAAGQPNCVLDASVGRAGLSSCADTVNTQWSFNEQAFCEGCSYTFYALVECGREMHLPLWDMEGGDVTVTDMLTGLPVSLSCRNETARADAGEIPYPVVISGDCCAGGGDEEWWGPPFDETDNAGAGQVSWGFPSCPSLLVYDANADGAVGCAELPGCGGELDQLTPGENQVMDCSIRETDGLCGIYRIDVVSGGFVWDLFANCDGANAPQFPIFHDCTDAWAAWNPLPELAVTNLLVDDGCPDLTVDFDIVNLGCSDHVGDITVRLVSDCVPADSSDHVVSGPFPAGGTVPVVLPFSASCSPVRVEVFVDPDDAVAECTESPTAAACNAEAGVDSLADFSCGCTANLGADAGPALQGCDGQDVWLDGSASTIAPCAQPLYRWLDSGGGLVRDWDPDPTVSVAVTGCPAGESYTLEVSCQGEPCSGSDSVSVTCFSPVADAGSDLLACEAQTALLSGAASSLPGCAAPEYRWLAPDSSVARDWDPDPELDLGQMDCAFNGDWTLEVRCPALGSCTDSASVRLDCLRADVSVIPNEVRACSGQDALVTPADVTVDAVNCAAVEYRWRDALSGGVLIDWSSDPSLGATFGACPAVVDLLLDARCADAGAPACQSSDAVSLVCPEPVPPAPGGIALCSGPSATLACGAAEPGVSYSWDLDTGVDTDGNGDPADDADLGACDGQADYLSAGTRTLRAWATEATAGCRSFADLVLEVFDAPLPPTPAALTACPGTEVSLSCGADDPALTYSWDYDTTVDSDGDGDASNDADAIGCDQLRAYPAGDHALAVRAADAQGCGVTVALNFNVAADSAPPAVAALQLQRIGDALDMNWDPVVGAASYRVLRGSLGIWYDHAVDDSAGKGACDTAGATAWTDPDDGALGASTYYLITAVSACGLEGSSGLDSQATPRPDRTPSASCP